MRCKLYFHNGIMLLSFYAEKHNCIKSKLLGKSTFEKDACLNTNLKETDF